MLAYRNPQNGRRYSIRLCRDLFHTPVIILSWCGSRLPSGSQTTVLLDTTSPLRQIRALRKMRKAHGYKLSSNSTPSGPR